jgi:phosphoglycolate phosphatase-like HAD superfamily hydrolase
MTSPSDRSAAVVLDLDGVLTDTRHRMHFLARRPKDWDQFFSAAAEDPVHPEGLALARAAVAEDRVLVYLSGRPERTRQDTVAWLQRHEAPPGQLLLRPEGDRRPARYIKLAELRRLSRSHRLDVLVDDDPDAVRAVRAARPRLVSEVILATWQPRDEMLHSAQEREGRT